MLVFIAGVLIVIIAVALIVVVIASSLAGIVGASLGILAGIFHEGLEDPDDIDKLGRKVKTHRRNK